MNKPDRDISERIVHMFEAIDAQDTERFLKYLSPDAEFRFGSADAVIGTDRIGEAVDGFFSSITNCSHRLEKSLYEDDTIVCEGEVTYRRHNQSKVTLPFVNVFEMSGELISRYKIYIDIAPLYAE